MQNICKNCTVVILVILIITGCVPEEESFEQPVRNECCLNEECINLREAFSTTLDNASSPTTSRVQIMLTSGGLNIYSDAIELVFNSADPVELLPGKYEWADGNSGIPNTVSHGAFINVTAVPTDLYGHGTIDIAYYSADHGYVTIAKDGAETTFSIFLESSGKSMTGYFKGVVTAQP